MGWCSATEIFDDMCEALLENGEKRPEDIKCILRRLAGKLEDMDWDCQSDSAYWDHPVVREIFTALGHTYEDNV